MAIRQWLINYANNNVSVIDAVSVIDTATNTVIGTINVGTFPIGVTIYQEKSK